ncbi:MAG: hypothetical protein Q9159_002944 [Coniocarpon cinnabarinum]
MATSGAQLGGTDPVYFFNVGDGRWQQFLSPWYPVGFKDREGVEYRSSEMYMMYQKALLFKDKETAEKIQKAKTPAEQKQLGREVKNFDSNIWNEHKVSIVGNGNYLKFQQGVSHHQGSNPEPRPDSTLRGLLLETGEKEIVEASPTDRIWGIGFSIEDAPSSDRSQWGENLQGKSLMDARDKLRANVSDSRESL